jgi:hypothetical protein
MISRQICIVGFFFFEFGSSLLICVKPSLLFLNQCLLSYKGKENNSVEERGKDE